MLSNHSDSEDEGFVKVDFKVNDTHIVVDSFEKQRVSVASQFATINTNSKELIFNISINDEVLLDTVLLRKDVKEVFISYHYEPLRTQESKADDYIITDTIGNRSKEILIITFTKEEVRELNPH